MVPWKWTIRYRTNANANINLIRKTFERGKNLVKLPNCASDECITFAYHLNVFIAIRDATARNSTELLIFGLGRFSLLLRVTNDVIVCQNGDDILQKLIVGFNDTN